MKRKSAQINALIRRCWINAYIRVNLQKRRVPFFFSDQRSSWYCLFEDFPDLRRWQTVIRKSQPATEDENAGRSTHCVFVLGRKDGHFVSGRTNQRVSYAPGKGNRYPPSKDSSHNRRVGNPPFKVKNKCVSAVCVCVIGVLHTTGMH